ncbi:hypothetical protein LXL04_023892 [Taraxacum kok-saghyz]
MATSISSYIDSIDESPSTGRDLKPGGSILKLPTGRFWRATCRILALRDNKFSMYYPEVEQIVVQRWDKMTIPLHCLGYALNPKYYDKRYQYIVIKRVKPIHRSGPYQYIITLFVIKRVKPIHRSGPYRSVPK